MELEGHEEHEDEEEEEEEEEAMGFQTSYDLLGNSQRVTMGTSSGVQTTTTTSETTPLKAKYRECLKNHAVGIGGHAVDGCGEFMPAGPDGTLDALKCAACNCHRNFHRKEFNNNHPPPPLPPPPPADVYFHGGRHHIQVPQFTPYYRTPGGYVQIGPPQQRLLALPSTSGGGQSREEQDDASNPGGGGGSSAAARKRFRTKFSQEQKERMLGLAERLGWRIQKHDEALVQQFCNETGVRRHVLKVWMHNNKHTLGKKP